MGCSIVIPKAGIGRGVLGADNLIRPSSALTSGCVCLIFASKSVTKINKIPMENNFDAFAATADYSSSCNVS